MNQRKPPGVKKLSVKFEFLLFQSVNGVADHGIAEVPCVDAYLVRSARVQIEAAKRKIFPYIFLKAQYSLLLPPAWICRVSAFQFPETPLLP